MPASDQGKLSGRYTLIPRTLIFLIRGDWVLLLKGGAHKRLWAGLYNGIGGHVERGEDALSAARRELLEETGLEAPDLRLCGCVTIDTGQATGVGIFILRGECPAGEGRPSKEGTLEWTPRSQLENLPLVEDLPYLLPRVLAWQPGDPVFSALYCYDEHGRLKIRFYPEEQWLN